MHLLIVGVHQDCRAIPTAIINSIVARDEDRRGVQCAEYILRRADDGKFDTFMLGHLRPSMGDSGAINRVV